MNIVHKLALDLQMPVGGKIYVKQGDTMTRSVILSLYDGGTVFNTANAGIFQIVFLKPDKTGGVYDTMPDNTTACTVDGNEVTAKLHPQMFTSPGSVKCELRMLNTGGSKILSSFSWIIYVEASAESGIKSESYYRFNSIESVAAAIGELNKLNTEAKNSLVDAINELHEGAQKEMLHRIIVNSALQKLTKHTVTAYSSFGIAYEATVDDFGSSNGLGSPAVAIGTEIILVPQSTNQGEPTLSINEGEAYPLCLRPGWNVDGNDLQPVTLLPIRAGMLLRGAEYVFRFDGGSWVLQSYVAQPETEASETVYVSEEEPEGAEDGSVWIDTDEDPAPGPVYVTQAQMEDYVESTLGAIPMAEEGAY